MVLHDRLLLFRWMSHYRQILLNPYQFYRLSFCFATLFSFETFALEGSSLSLLFQSTLLNEVRPSIPGREIVGCLEGRSPLFCLKFLPGMIPAVAAGADGSM
jgi:hypothetical protein